MSSPTISIIMPVYNIAPYLAQCLDSILAQTMSDFEVLCVDDGSTDESASILHSYAEKDKRIQVFSQKNQGAASARNLALAKAKGQYVAFMDGDDLYPAPTVLETLTTTALKKKADVCGGNMLCFYDDDAPQPDDYRFRREGWVNYRDTQLDYGFYRYLYSLALLRSNEIQFPIYWRFEDPPFMVKALLCAQKFYTITEDVYLYRKRKAPPVWGEAQVIGLMSGLHELLQLAEENSLALLWQNTVKRINEEYSPAITAQLAAGSQACFLQLAQLQCSYTHAPAGLQPNRPALLQPAQSLCSAYATLSPAAYAQQQVEQNAATELSAIKKSFAYRIALCLGWLPKKIRGSVRCIKENGFAYTVKHIFGYNK